MRPTPPVWRAASFPVTVGLALAAAGVSIAYFTGRDVGRLFMGERAFFAEPWRLFTTTLPHTDIVHLLFNVYWLWVFGTFLEEQLGALRLSGLVLLFAVVSSAAEFATGSLGIGLSGVGYGFVGFLCAAQRRDQRFAEGIDRKTIQLFVAWFFLCIGMTLAKVWPVANVAHAAGAIIGLAMGVAATQPAQSSKGPPSVLGWAATAALLVASLLAATTFRPFFNMSPDAGLEIGGQGHAALVANRNAEAASLLERALRLSPKEPTLWFNLGIAYQRLNRVAESKQAYRRAAQLEPTNSMYEEAAR